MHDSFDMFYVFLLTYTQCIRLFSRFLCLFWHVLHDSFDAESEVLVQACRALVNLAAHNTDNQVQIAAAGGMCDTHVYVCVCVAVGVVVCVAVCVAVRVAVCVAV